MNLVELFTDFVDQIYFEGYARQLAESDPEKFDFELNEFLNNFDPVS